MTEEIITEINFEEYFFDARRFKPQKCQIMARYAAIAEFIDGPMKQNIIDLLKKDKAFAATQVMRKCGCATERDAVRICKEICVDMLSGMTDQEIEQKVYKYTMEAFYYTEQSNVPLDDPHWSVISIRNLDQFLDAQNNILEINTSIVKAEKSEENKDD